MRYEPYLSPTAHKKFDAFPEYVQTAVEKLIDKVCKNPVKHSRKAAFPYLPIGQTATVKIPKPGSVDFIVVTMFFRFGQDEKSIEIASFGSYFSSFESGEASQEGDE